ncbi:coiled-coil domain-containing protein 50 isoform X1 [Epinephelus fuscoguttatus]|uniref:coiled-coil domain-containing protein 50 isoform X1 n=1 Tax=Epinephelus fuscoguttatus TaxID=293821 RepID=UPI0020D0EE3A|nr:coiled-coil domain-containing protein 50 isoform X1 [Epinephelus fuscoguttatus]
MAECNVSIDKNKLPGVKEVCRDFAVLEDHCLAYNLQEQEIESHLASNVNKSRLVQKDLQVAKKLQEEEDQRAKVQTQKHHVEIERQDIEIAQEIQDQLVRQAEQQRQQEEKDAAIARKLQEKEMKEEKRRQKQLEANFEEEYFEDHGAARRPLDLDKPAHHKSPGRHDAYAPVSSHRDYSPDYSSTEPKRSRYPRQDPAAPHSRSRYPEHYLVAEGGRSRHADPYPEHLLPSRAKHGDRYPHYEPTETGRARGPSWEDTERVVRRKERPGRPPPPQSQVDRDKAWDKKRDRQHNRDRGRDPEWERHIGKEQRRDREQDLRGARAAGRDRERSRERGLSGDRQRERDRQRQTDKDRQRVRTRSMERGLDDEPGHSRDWPREGRASWEEEGDDGERERRAGGRQRVHSGPDEVFDELEEQGEGPGRERSHSHPSEDTGRIVHRVSGAVVAETEYGVSEATKGLTKLDIREQELKDMEVARKLQEEEIKASKMHVRAAQVAQDEEIARLIMEQEKKEYKRNREREHDREREKDKERERDRERLAMERMAMERRRAEGDYRPNSEEVVRPRTRDEYEYQRQRNHKPARPPQPRAPNYENVNSGGYGYMDHAVPPRAPTRPEAAYKGAYYKR